MSDDCPIEVLTSDLKIHEDECKYRKLKCPACNADDVPFIKLVDHLNEDDHGRIEDFKQCPINKKWPSQSYDYENPYLEFGIYDEIEYILWLPFFSHFDFSRKTKNFKPFFTKNEKKSHPKNRNQCCFLW